jgi:hypothetical protein
MDMDRYTDTVIYMDMGIDMNMDTGMIIDMETDLAGTDIDMYMYKDMGIVMELNNLRENYS